MKKQVISGVVLFTLTVMPFLASADIVSLQPLSSTTSISTSGAGPLSCFDFRSTLKKGSKSYEVRGLQYALGKEGFAINSAEYGVFGLETEVALNAFQQKYASEILKNLNAPTGMTGKMTRAKLNALYGCDNPLKLVTTNIPTSVVINVKNVSLDSNGVTVVFCNAGTSDIPVFPARVRLNGIIRDFSVPGATKAGTCDNDTIPYSAWGLTYDPGTTYGVVTSLDPNGMYKTAQTSYPLSATTTLSIPAVAGAHLSVRGITLKSTGLQGTLCNLGTADLGSYPVRVTINGISKDLDVTGAVRTRGQCQAVTWSYFDVFGITPVPSMIMSATINIDPNNLIQETNEFDNSATIVGSI